MTAVPETAGVRAPMRLLLAMTDAVAAVLLAADLAVVIGSVVLRSTFNAPVEWADDVARGLMVGLRTGSISAPQPARHCARACDRRCVHGRVAGVECALARDGARHRPADADRLRAQSHRRDGDRLRARARGADLHLGRRRA